MNTLENNIPNNQELLIQRANLVAELEAEKQGNNNSDKITAIRIQIEAIDHTMQIAIGIRHANTVGMLPKGYTPNTALYPNLSRLGSAYPGLPQIGEYPDPRQQTIDFGTTNVENQSPNQHNATAGSDSQDQININAGAEEQEAFVLDSDENKIIISFLKDKKKGAEDLVDLINQLCTLPVFRNTSRKDILTREIPKVIKNDKSLITQKDNAFFKLLFSIIQPLLNKNSIAAPSALFSIENIFNLHNDSNDALLDLISIHSEFIGSDESSRKYMLDSMYKNLIFDPKIALEKDPRIKGFYARMRITDEAEILADLEKMSLELANEVLGEKELAETIKDKGIKFSDMIEIADEIKEIVGEKEVESLKSTPEKKNNNQNSKKKKKKR